MSLSKLIKKQMIDKDVDSYEELAEMSGVSVQRIRRLMQDLTSCKLDDACKVVECLGGKLSAIF